MTSKKFKYVYVPCDSGAEVEERELAVPPGQEIECLTKHLQARERALRRRPGG